VMVPYVCEANRVLNRISCLAEGPLVAPTISCPRGKEGEMICLEERNCETRDAGVRNWAVVKHTGR